MKPSLVQSLLGSVVGHEGLVPPSVVFGGSVGGVGVVGCVGGVVGCVGGVGGCVGGSVGGVGF